MDTIFENYELFIREHSDEISTPSGAVRMLNDEGMFRAYADSLTEGLEAGIRASVLGVLNREREMILSESANVAASTFASGWTVLSFPILVDIYAEPIIAELMNVYPIDKPIISIPRVRIKAQTRSYDGSSVEESYIPTNTKLIRAGVVDVNVAPGASVNVFTSTGLSPANLKMNRRYTLVTNVNLTDAVPVTYNVAVNIRPDNRNQISAEFTYTNSISEIVTCTMQGHVDYEKGIIVYQILTSGSTAAVTTNYATFSLRFTPVATMNGRTKVVVETQMNDVFIDPNEDFLIDLTEEDMQDYSSIFKIDLLRTISEAIKRQVLLNKDYDLAYFLKAAETDIAANGAKQSIDLTAYTGATFGPNSSLDVLKNVIPRISTLISTIRRNYNMYPSYAVAGLKTASLLRSLQDMLTNMPNVRGELGFTGASAQFLKLKVLEAMAIDDNKIYISTKAPNNALEKSSIVDLVFQPLYVVKEITDGNTRHFVRSRTMIEVARTDGLGLLEITDGLTDFVG